MSPTLHWLTQQCQQFLLNEKWLLCHKTSIGQTWKDRINLSGAATVNLHSKTIRSIALSLAADTLCQQGITVLDRSKSIAVGQELLAEARTSGGLSYFRSLEHSESLARLITRSIEDLRLAMVQPNQLTNQSIRPSTKASDLKLLYEAYCNSLQDRRLADFARCIEIAISRIKSGELVLKDDLKILIPTELELSTRENLFLKFLGERSQILTVRTPQSLDEVQISIAQRAVRSPTAFQYAVCQGEVNEIRSATQRLLHSPSGQPVKLDDIEFVYTDSCYATLIYEYFNASFERLRGEGLESGQNVSCPVTFSEGVPSIYSRPGRALRAWLRWKRAEFVQSKVVQMVREGLIQRPESAEEIGYARLASNLRAISIGFDRARYLPQIQTAIDKAAQLQAEHERIRQQNPDESEADRPRDFGLPALHALHQMFQSILEVTPTEHDSASVILAKSKRFLQHCARCDGRLDREARGKLLDAIDAKAQSLEFAAESAMAILCWLEELPLQAKILRDGPQPGCIHACQIRDAGFTGRKHFFVFGLEAGRFPRNIAVDPVLLDEERRAISKNLRTTLDKAEVEQQSLFALLSRILECNDIQVQLSFSNRDLVEDRELLPSPAIVDLFRLTQNNPRANLEDLLNFVGPAISFVGLHPVDWLDTNEQLVAGLLGARNRRLTHGLLERRHIHFELARFASANRDRPEFTAFDGWVPQAGSILDPTLPGSKCSASRLETFGTCPRRFFFRFGLGVMPPDQWNVDPEQWLDPMQLGSLIHEVFEAFMRDLTNQSLAPSLQRDKGELLRLLHTHVRAYQETIPIPNEDARDRQVEQLEEMCYIFLREEQRYCEATGAFPWILEASFGLSDEPRSILDCTEPIELTLNDGRKIRSVGRIDRIDRLVTSGSASYSIWDYKSGSDFGYKADNPFHQGRKLQSFLYVSMLRHRLVAQGNGNPTAISFGYFFPNPKTEGLRIAWSASELKQGDSILQTICDMITNGLFPATTNKNDCCFCDYAGVCGDASFVSAESLRLAIEPVNRDLLADWIKLRGIESTEGSR